jgi:hypothetical protein
MMNVYADCQKFHGNSSYKRIKTRTLEEAYIEALMQDGKAFKQELLIFRSNFAKAFDVK